MRFTWSGAADGDLSGDLTQPDLAAASALTAAPRPWTWLRQVHGTEVVVVTRPGEHAGAAADAAVTDRTGCALVVRVADCAPVVLEGRRSVAVLHLGWRGLTAGLAARAAAAMRALDDEPVVAHLGPCIRPGCYEFAGPELQLVADRFGSAVVTTTSAGTPALDLPGAVAVALGEAGVERLEDLGACTACAPGWFSHRARGDQARQAALAWIES